MKTSEIEDQVINSWVEEKRHLFKKWAALVGTILFVIVMLQNLDMGTIDFLFWSLELPKLVIYLTMTVLGMIGGAVSYKKWSGRSPSKNGEL